MSGGPFICGYDVGHEMQNSVDVYLEEFDPATGRTLVDIYYGRETHLPWQIQPREVESH